LLGKPQKKVFLLIAGPLRPNPPSLLPTELNGRWKVGTLEKKRLKKAIFFINGPAFTSLPPLNGHFFAAFLNSDENNSYSKSKWVLTNRF